MRSERCRFEHLDGWSRLRSELWPQRSAEDHRRGLAEALSLGGGDVAAFAARADGGEIIGFAETTLRHDHVNGCETSPVVFLEAVYVAPAHRGRGAARALCAAVEAWGRSHGCRELAADVAAGDAASHRFHTAVGFEETGRVVFFRRVL